VLPPQCSAATRAWVEVGWGASVLIEEVLHCGRLQEFSWKARCKKENAEFDAKVAAANGLPQGEGGVSLNLGATNPHLSADMPAASLGSVMREQAKLCVGLAGHLWMTAS